MITCDIIRQLSASTGMVFSESEVSSLLESGDKLLSFLTEREEKVLRLRSGLGDGYPRTLEQVGSVLNVTRERVRQIEANALRKLNNKINAKCKSKK